MSHTLSHERVKRVCETIYKTSEEYLPKLCSVWSDLGLDNAAIDERCTTVESHTKSLFEEMVREELELKERLKKKIDGLLQHLNTINVDLDMSASCSIDNLALMPAKAKLEECLSSLRTKHTERLEERTKLEFQERALCQQLGKEPLVKPQQKALADEALASLKNHIKTLTAKRCELVSSFRAAKSAIVELYAELETQPLTSFEQSIVTANPETHSLTPANMTSIKDLQCRLEKDLSQMQEDVERLRERLSQLWERLEVDANERESFLENFPGYSRRTRNALNEEIQRCEELKHQNIERFIVRMRLELQELWVKCCVSEEEQAAFEPFYNTEFSDELLEAHEAEVRRLEAYFTANRPFFELLAKRSDLWERMSVLESKAYDKDRLFQNRGGQLLKEEKERKQLQKDVPHVEKELKRMIVAWEGTSGESFMLYGRRALDLLNEQWENRKQGKERVKQERKQAQQKQLEHEAVMGTTVVASGKRKLMGTTPDMPRKHPRMTPAQASVSKVPSTINKNSSIRRLPQRRTATATRSTRQKQDISNHPLPFPLININVMSNNHAAVNESLASSISYTDFTQHLEVRATRSSTTSGVQLRTARPVLSPLKSDTPQSKICKQYPQSAPAKSRFLRSTPKAQTPMIQQKRTPLTAVRFTRTRNQLPIIF